MPIVNIEKDLGVHMTPELDWKDHINHCIKKATSCMAWITRTIITRDAEVMVNLYKALVRPHLEYCVHLWSPMPRHGNWQIIMEIEDVQRKYTRLIAGIGVLPYEERLAKLSLKKETSLTTLIERRARGDLIETFKIIHGYVNYGKNLFKLSRNGINLVIPPISGKQTPGKCDALSRRVVKYWNTLPSHVKKSKSLNCFKANLESHKSKCRDPRGNYWTLSEEIFGRINDENRSDHIAYLMDHTYVAKSKYINLK